MPVLKSLIPVIGMGSAEDFEDVIVKWKDGSQNCVRVKELRAVKRGDQIGRIGTKVKMYYKKRWYFGTVIFTERDDSQPKSVHSTNDGNAECARSMNYGDAECARSTNDGDAECNTNDGDAECARSTNDGDAECVRSTNDGDAECARSTNDGDADCVRSTNDGDAECARSTNDGDAEYARSTNDGDAECVRSPNNSDVECPLSDKLLDRDEDAERFCENAKDYLPTELNISHVDENVDAYCALYDKVPIHHTKSRNFLLSNKDHFLNVAREVANESPLLDLNITIENNTEEAQMCKMMDEDNYQDPYADIDVEDPDDPDYQIPTEKNGNYHPDSDDTYCAEDLSTERTVEKKTFQPESILQLRMDDSRSNVQSPQCCEVIGCNEEVFAACVRCSIFNCYNHFLNDNSCDDHQKRPLQSLTSRHNKENELCEAQAGQGGTEYTKKGTLRKRKHFENSIEERKKLKKTKNMLKHSLKPSCEDTCRKKCNSLIDEEQRKNINQSYWLMTWNEQRLFLKGRTSVVIPVKKVSNPKKKNRSKSVKYFLTSKTGEMIQVCRTFFLATLGFEKNNEKVVRNAINDMKSPPFDGRGQNVKKHKVDHGVIKTHIESFKPTISHYRREHAPNKRYLSSELTIKFMHDDFLQTNPDTEISYDLYRKTIKELNISFAKLGHEECETCEQYDLHNPNKNDFRHRNCEMCLNYEKHNERYNAARKKYDEDRNFTKTEAANDVGYFSADLQKVIMLPRIEMFKAVLFCPRLIVFNESFVPLGNKRSDRMTYAAIWHEAISGRKKEDIISAFKAFLTYYRDLKEIVLWLDNCSAQNKNWALISFLIYFINSDETSSNKITFRYFEPGHTYMSADEFHHQVEQALKQKKKVYDFEDFADAVASTNNRKTIVKKMDISNFCNVPDNTSTVKIQQSNPRPYLRDIVEICFKRGSKFMFYKCSFDSPDYIQLDCMKKNTLKKGLVAPDQKTNSRGITKARKNVILNTLGPLMPVTRKKFWEELPVNDNAVDLSQVIQD